MDIFAVDPTLRSRDEPYAASPILGFLSLLIFGLFIAIFINKLLMIARKDAETISVTNTFSVKYLL
jgi:hypothetical protein